MTRTWQWSWHHHCVFCCLTCCAELNDKRLMVMTSLMSCCISSFALHSVNLPVCLLTSNGTLLFLLPTCALLIIWLILSRMFHFLNFFPVAALTKQTDWIRKFKMCKIIGYWCVFSCVESYLQSTYWPEPCESNKELEEPVKKKPRHTLVCVLYFDCLSEKALIEFKP